MVTPSGNYFAGWLLLAAYSISSESLNQRESSVVLFVGVPVIWYQCTINDLAKVNDHRLVVEEGTYLNIFSRLKWSKYLEWPWGRSWLWYRRLYGTLWVCKYLDGFHFGEVTVNWDAMGENYYTYLRIEDHHRGNLGNRYIGSCLKCWYNERKRHTGGTCTHFHQVFRSRIHQTHHYSGIARPSMLHSGNHFRLLFGSHL